MRTSYLLICSLLVLAIFSCTSYDDELIAEKNEVKARCIVPENSILLKICEDYNYSNYPNCEFLIFHAQTTETFFGYWQLQYRNKNGNWEYARAAQYDYGIYCNDGFQTLKSYYQYGDVDFRARKIEDFIYAQEVNPIPGYVTDWTPICTVYNNYVEKVGLITDSYVTIVFDFVFSSTWPQDRDGISKATYDWGFNAVLEGVNYPKPIPRPTETTSNPYTHRYSITLDKGDYYAGDFLNFHLKNLSPEKMYWQDRKFEGEVIKMDKLITITVPVDIR